MKISIFVITYIPASDISELPVILQATLQTSTIRKIE